LYLWFFFTATLLVSMYLSRHRGIVRAGTMTFGTTNSSRRRYLAAMILVGVFAISFFSTLVAFGSTVRTVYNSVASSLFEGPIATLGAPRVTTGIVPIATLLIRLYGGEFVYIGLAISLTVGAAAKAFRKRQGVTAEMLLLSSFLVVSLAIGFMFLWYGLIIGYSVTRFVKYPFLISALMLGAHFAA